jgi:uncharacterized protein (DUF427 family)
MTRTAKESTLKTIWNGAILAESDKTIVVESNYYFPPDSFYKERFHYA